MLPENLFNKCNYTLGYLILQCFGSILYRDTNIITISTIILLNVSKKALAYLLSLHSNSDINYFSRFIWSLDIILSLIISPFREMRTSFHFYIKILCFWIKSKIFANQCNVLLLCSFQASVAIYFVLILYIIFPRIFSHQIPFMYIYNKLDVFN